MVGVDGRGRDADGDAAGIDLLAPMHDVVFGRTHGVSDAHLVHRADLAVDDTATVVMPLERASSPPRTAESYQSDASRRLLRSMTESIQEEYGTS